MFFEPRKMGKSIHRYNNVMSSRSTLGNRFCSTAFQGRFHRFRQSTEISSLTPFMESTWTGPHPSRVILHTRYSSITNHVGMSGRNRTCRSSRNGTVYEAHLASSPPPSLRLAMSTRCNVRRAPYRIYLRRGSRRKSRKSRIAGSNPAVCPCTLDAISSGPRLVTVRGCPLGFSSRRERMRAWSVAVSRPIS